MSMFSDATCPKCGKRYGWQGKVRIPCPRCGHLVKESPEDKKAIDDMIELLTKRMLADDQPTG